MKKKLLIIIIAVVVVLAAAAVVIFLLLGRGGEDEVLEDVPVEETVNYIPAPIEYAVETDSVTALPVGGAVTVIDETPEPEVTEGSEEAGDSEDSEESEESGETQSEAAVYRYEGLTTMAQRVADYCTLLTQEDFGFTPVDAERYETTLPDFTQTTQGSVQLVRPITVITEVEGEEGEEPTTVETDDGLFSLQLTWDAESCTVSVDHLEGGIRVPVEESAPAGQQGMSMTLLEAVDYVCSLSPEALGLAGESMEEYHVYALNGVVLVGETPCLQLNIYGDSPGGTNAIAGQYLLSNDGLHVYRVEDGIALEVNI